MQDEASGLPIKSVKSFMSKIPSVFTGGDLIQWILRTLDVDDTGMVLIEQERSIVLLFAF